MKTGILLASVACASANPLEWRLLRATDEVHARATVLAGELTRRILQEDGMPGMGMESASGIEEDSMPDSGNMFTELGEFMDPEAETILANPEESWTTEVFETMVQEYASAKENENATICAVGATMELSGDFLDFLKAQEEDTNADLKDEIMEGEQDIIPMFNVPCGSDVDTSQYIMPTLFAAYGIQADDYACRGSACKCAGFNIKMMMQFKMDFEKMLMSGVKEGMKGMYDMDPSLSDSQKKQQREAIDKMSFGDLMGAMDPTFDKSKSFNDYVKESIDSDESKTAAEKKSEKELVDKMKDGFSMKTNVQANTCVSPEQAYGKASLKVKLPDLNEAESDTQKDAGVDFKLKADGVVNVYSGSTLKEKKASPLKKGDKVFRYEKNNSTGTFEKKERTVVSVDESTGTVEIDDGSGSTATVSMLALTTPAEESVVDLNQADAENPEIDNRNGAVSLATSATAALILGAFAVILA